MRLVELALRRRITVAMLTVALVLFGLVAFTRLRVGLLPDVSYPSLTIETKLAGAAPAEIEQLVSRPIEERIGVVAGVRRVRSISRAGLSQVTLELAWDRDMDFAAIDVREKLERLRLPDGTEPPTLLRFDPATDPIMRLYLHGDADLFALRRAAEDVVEKDLESTDGVAAIEVRGGYESEIEIEIDEGRLALVGLGIDEVVAQLTKANVDQAGGSLYEREARYLVRARNRFADLDDIRASVLVERDRHRVTVGDVATVRRTHRERETITRLGADEAVELAIYKEGDANTTQVAAALHQRLEQVHERVPADMQLTVAADQSTFIRAAVDEVLSSAVSGGLLAVLVLLLFLRDLRSTLVIATSIPISVVGTFFLMYETGTTLNVMSLGGLALGVGMLVDNAIVVLESIHRHRERGIEPVQAARIGAGEVGGAVIASTLTTVAVFVPVVFLDGIAAQLFRDMALTVCFSLLVSLAVSLTLIPMMVALQPAPDARPRSLRLVAAPLLLVRWTIARVLGLFAWLCAPIARVFDRALRAIDAGYPRLLRAGVRRPAATIGFATIAFLASLHGLGRLGLDLVPPLAQGELSFVVELAPGTPIAVTDRTLREAASVLDGDPRVERLATIAGRGAIASAGAGAQGEHTGAIGLRLVEGSTPADEAEVAATLREQLHALGVTRHRAVRPAVFSLHRPIEVEIVGDDLEGLRDAGELVQRELEAIDGLVEVRSSAELGSPEVQVRFDRERILARGLTVEGVATTLRRKLQGEVSTKLRERDRDIDIRVRSVSRNDAQLEDLRQLIVGKVGEVPIRLADVAKVELGRGPTEIDRIAQARAAIVDADVVGRDVGAIARDIDARLAQLALPPGVSARLAGQDEEMERAIAGLVMAMALAAFLVYVVMASQFESLLQPLIVMFTLPLGAVGVVAALWLTGSSISVISLIGCVMLAGIVVNNAIVLVDAVNRRREHHGEGVLAALCNAGRERLRPILMTSITTILGLLPMALGLGAGAELRRALAIAVIGGLTVATALTLVVIPTIYWLVYRYRDAPVDPRSA